MRKKAFTLIELLVVIAIIVLLLTIMMPGLQRAKEKTREVICGSEAKQQGLALTMYAQQNDEVMPMMTWGGGEWLWDVSYFTTDVIIDSGATKAIFRCPSNRVDTSVTRYWRYSENFSGTVTDATPEPSSTLERQQHWRVVGFSYMMETAGGRGDIWAPSEPGAPKVPSTQKEFISKATQPGRLELVTDTVIEYQTYDKWIIPDLDSDWAMGTNHMGEIGEPIEPSGGNIGFLDGHVSWRHFKDMYQRYRVQGVTFWW